MIERIKSAWRGWNFDLPAIQIEKECHDISHTLSDIDKGSKKFREGMSPPKRKDYVSEASVVFNQPVFKKEKDALIEEQVYWMAENTTNGKETEFHKGTINGIRIYYEQFEDMHGEHMNDVNPKEVFDGTSVLPEYKVEPDITR